VIIGGHRKKAEKVLQYLPRMFMPMQNYQDLEPELLDAYRLEGRDIRGVRSFSALVPEVFFFDDLQQRRLGEYLRLRLEFDRKAGLSEGLSVSAKKEELERREAELRGQAEEEIRRRIEAICQCVESGRTVYGSLEDLFRLPQKPILRKEEAL
jgi:hypothetical protein